MVRKKFKKLKVLRDNDYAFTVGNIIHVNVQRLWKESNTFRKFAKMFATTHTHEVLHILMTQVRPKSLIGEEKSIRILLDEPWDAELEKIYEELYS